MTALEFVDVVRKELDYFDTVLPNVTPEETDYLQREQKAVQKQYQDEVAAKRPHAPSDARMTALANRRLYRVWLARKDLADAITSVNGIYDPKTATQLWSDQRTTVMPLTNLFRRDQPDTLNRMLRAAYYVDQAVGTLRDFYDFETYQRVPLLSPEQNQKFYALMLMVSNDLRDAMQCQLAHVVLDPPVRTGLVP
jgi:hypothetical protein